MIVAMVWGFAQMNDVRIKTIWAAVTSQAINKQRNSDDTIRRDSIATFHSPNPIRLKMKSAKLKDQHFRRNEHGMCPLLPVPLVNQTLNRNLNHTIRTNISRRGQRQGGGATTICDLTRISGPFLTSGLP